MFSSLDVSTSGLVAQRTRLNAISSNIANMSTTRNEHGEPEPYQPRFVTFQTDDKPVDAGRRRGREGRQRRALERAAQDEIRAGPSGRRYAAASSAIRPSI